MAAFDVPPLKSVAAIHIHIFPRYFLFLDMCLGILLASYLCLQIRKKKKIRARASGKRPMGSEQSRARGRGGSLLEGWDMVRRSPHTIRCAVTFYSCLWKTSSPLQPRFWSNIYLSCHRSQSKKTCFPIQCSWSKTSPSIDRS